MYGGMWKNGDSGSTSGPQTVPIRSTTGWMPLPWRLCVVSGSTDFLKATIRCGSAVVGSARLLVPGDLRPADVHAEAARDGEPADLPRPGGVERVEQTGRVRAEVADRVASGDAAGEVDDVADVVAIAQGEERVPVE